MAIQLETRSPTEGDLRFIHSSWHTSYWKTCMRKKMERSVYAPTMDAYIDFALDNHLNTVLVVFSPEVPDEVLGWICARSDLLYWLYVKGYARRKGIASGLVNYLDLKFYALDSDASGRKFAESVGLKFNPLY